MSAKATRKTHSVHSFPRRRVLIPFDRSFTAEEFERVKLGVVPREMEDHWSIFLPDQGARISLGNSPGAPANESQGQKSIVRAWIIE